MPKRNNKKNPPKADKKQEKVFVDLLGGDDFEDYVQFLKSPKKIFLFNFLRGTGFGLGTILGTATILSIIVYLFSYFVKIPMLGEWLDRIFGSIKI
jgi:hypothetical protein